MKTSSNVQDDWLLKEPIKPLALQCSNGWDIIYPLGIILVGFIMFLVLFIYEFVNTVKVWNSYIRIT